MMLKLTTREHTLLMKIARFRNRSECLTPLNIIGLLVTSFLKHNFGVTNSVLLKSQANEQKSTAALWLTNVDSPTILQKKKMDTKNFI